MGMSELFTESGLSRNHLCLCVNIMAWDLWVLSTPSVDGVEEALAFGSDGGYVNSP